MNQKTLPDAVIFPKCEIQNNILYQYNHHRVLLVTVVIWYREVCLLKWPTQKRVSRKQNNNKHIILSSTFRVDL